MFLKAAVVSGLCAGSTQEPSSQGRPQALAGDRFTLGQRVFQLADIGAPSVYALGASHAPFAVKARAILDDLLARGVQDIESLGEETRWGAGLVKVRLTGGVVLQERLIALGAARVYPKTDDIAFIGRLLAMEEEARETETGLWTLPAYRIRRADAFRVRDLGAYHLTEGRVLGASARRSRTFLNFGEDYRTDFTATIANGTLRKWRKTPFNPASFEGAMVRVRGYVASINGPSVEVTHPAQIERLTM
ncbi:MAG: thermonuclease family protein [Pseudomonadota bacterium]